MLVKFCLHFILIYFQIRKILSSLVFSFEKICNSENYSMNLINNNIYSNISLGSPLQTIPFYLSFDSNLFIIKDKIIGGFFNEEISKSLSKNNDREFILHFEGTTYYGYYKTENFLFKNNKNKNIKVNNLIFSLSNNYNNSNSIKTNELINNYSIIGLKLSNYRGNINKESFIMQLKDKKILDTYSFSFEYESKEKGLLYLGCCINQFDNNYQLSNYRYTKVEYDRNNFEWKINFDKVNYSENNSEPIFKDGIFNINIGGMIGNYKYKEFIYENVFNKYLKENICFEEIIYDKYLIIYCNKNFNIKEFPNIVFYHKNMNYSFVFDYNDLFTENNDKIYFNVFFNIKFSSFYWIFGEIFFRKYQIVFDQDKQLIGFWINKKNVKKFNYQKYLYISFICIIIFLIVVIYNIKNKIPRKIKANELEENIIYNSINDGNNKHLFKN